MYVALSVKMANALTINANVHRGGEVPYVNIVEVESGKTPYFILSLIFIFTFVIKLTL